MAGSALIGLGTGTIILLILWITTVSLWIVLHRSQGGLRIIVTLISSVTTLILFLLPPETPDDVHPRRYSLEEEVVYDYMFIWRAILIIILTLSLLGGMALSISQFWTLKVHGSEAVPRHQAKYFNPNDQLPLDEDQQEI